jgi:hypothetical protein
MMMINKKIALACVLLGTSFNSFADDDWSGFYAGGSLGVASYSATFNDLDDDWDNQGLNGDNNIDGNIGVHAGVNFQEDSFVYGIEIGYTYFDNTSTGLPNYDDTPDDRLSSRLKGAVSLRARAGLAAGKTLFYLAAGPQWAETIGLSGAVGLERQITPNLSARLQAEITSFETTEQAETQNGNRMSHDDDLSNLSLGISYLF